MGNRDTGPAMGCFIGVVVGVVLWVGVVYVIAWMLRG
jgi:hypothetical protein